MDLSVMALPVPADKVEILQQMLTGLHGPRRAQTEEIHRQAGVHERGYMQPMPDDSYLYIGVFESTEPATALKRVMEANASDPDYAQWIFPRLQNVFGMDPAQGIPPMPEQVYDSGPLD